MAIQFARIEYVKRSIGQNACHKAAYNGREHIKCERTGQVYNYVKKGDLEHHEILLPEGVSSKYRSARELWNAVEARENRVDSQVAKEMVLALPDDVQVTVAQKIELCKTFVEKHFVAKGLICQIDVHRPHTGLSSLRKQGSTNNHEIPGQASNVRDDTSPGSVNWHAHVLMPTRLCNGEIFGLKARDLDVDVRLKRVVSHDKQWGKLWAQHQNEYFAEHGIDLKVDATGIVPEIHLGPVRMRGQNMHLVTENEILKQCNESLKYAPELMLSKLIEREATFTKKDVDRYLSKHILAERREEIEGRFWNLKEIVLLPDNKFTSKEIVESEKRILRFAERLAVIPAKAGIHSWMPGQSRSDKEALNEEQKAAFDHIIKGPNLVCIQGRAGTGKSYLLKAVHDIYKDNGYSVRGLAPTSSVADDMRKNGIINAKNLHAFLFHHKNGLDSLQKNEVLIIDEASMIPNAIMGEILSCAWKNNCKVIFVGDEKQLSSIERGGMFKEFCARFGSAKLENIQRQTFDWQKHMANYLAQGNVLGAMVQLKEHDRFHFNQTEDDAMIKLLDQWHEDYVKYPCDSFFILDYRNAYVNRFNEAIHDMLLQKKEIDSKEVYVHTSQGYMAFSVGDKIICRENNTKLGIINGTAGILIEASKDRFAIQVDEERAIAFNPKEYITFQHGYAGTIHMAQGKTFDRVYVLHCDHMNKNLFYVACTRHRKDVHYFTHGNKYYDQLQKEDHASLTQHHEDVFKGSYIGRAFDYIKDRFYKNHDFYNLAQKVRDYKDLGYLITRRGDLHIKQYRTIGMSQIGDHLKGQDVLITKDCIDLEYKIREIGVHSCYLLNEKNEISECLIGKDDRFSQLYDNYFKTLSVPELLKCVPQKIFTVRMIALEQNVGKEQAFNTFLQNEKELRLNLESQYDNRHVVQQILYYKEKHNQMPTSEKINDMKMLVEQTSQYTHDPDAIFKITSSCLTSGNFAKPAEPQKTRDDQLER